MHVEIHFVKNHDVWETFEHDIEFDAQDMPAQLTIAAIQIDKIIRNLSDNNQNVCFFCQSAAVKHHHTNIISDKVGPQIVADAFVWQSCDSIGCYQKGKAHSRIPPAKNGSHRLAGSLQNDVIPGRKPR